MLPCIRAQIGGISARNLHLRQSGGGGYNRISVHVCERTDVYIAEQNIIIKKNNTQPFKEGNKKMYTRVISFGDFFILHSDIIR